MTLGAWDSASIARRIKEDENGEEASARYMGKVDRQTQREPTSIY